MRYFIDFLPKALWMLQELPKWKQTIAQEGIKQHLVGDPLRVGNSRKQLRSEDNVAVSKYWELRLGDIRVIYEVEEQPKPLVYVHAIGLKERERYRFGNEIVRSEDLISWLEAS